MHTFNHIDKNASRFDRRSTSPNVKATDIELACKLFFPNETIQHCQELTGGFSNKNYLITIAHKEIANKKYILRFHRNNKTEVTAELDLMQHCIQSGISVPILINKKLETQPYPLSLQEYIAAENLSNVIQNPKRKLQNIFTNIGIELAKIHQIKFKSSGLLGPQLQIATPFDNYANATLSYIQKPLSQRAGNRLGTTRLKALEELIQTHWHITAAIKNSARLVHSDFNPKNILVTADDQITVLDWEFSHAGSPLMDFANFFRFEEDYPRFEVGYQTGAKTWLIDAYQQHAQPLPQNWQAIAKLLDLSSLCEFLNAEDERPKTFATAVGVIDQTIGYFG